MNKTLIFSTVISAMLMIVTACNKEKEEPGVLHELKGTLFDNEALHLSDTVVKRGQTLSTVLADTSWTGEWSVEPDNGVKVLAQGRWAEILFTQPGSYTVMAKTKDNGPVYSNRVRVED